LGIDLPWTDEIVRAKRPQHLPVVLTRVETIAVGRRIRELARLGCTDVAVGGS
jgi:hypothetical protein